MVSSGGGLRLARAAGGAGAGSPSTTAPKGPARAAGCAGRTKCKLPFATMSGTLPRSEVVQLREGCSDGVELGPQLLAEAPVRLMEFGSQLRAEAPVRLNVLHDGGGELFL